MVSEEFDFMTRLRPMQGSSWRRIKQTQISKSMRGQVGENRGNGKRVEERETYREEAAGKLA